MQLSLKRNLIIGFGASLLILVISSIASLISIHNLFKSSYWVSHTSEVIQKLDETLSVMKDAEAGQRGFLITGNDEFLEPYNGSYGQVRLLITDVKNLTVDNPEQQVNIDRLDALVRTRFWKLKSIIDKKKASSVVGLEDMREAKAFMDSVRFMVNHMVTNENVLMKKRTDRLNLYSSYTPVLIVVAALLAIIITIIFYVKMSRDIAERAALQEQLIRKDAGITHRIDAIQRVSDKISAGDYSIRVSDGEMDGLAGISGALNKMAGSLEKSFRELSDKEWLQAGIAGLNEAIIGDDNIKSVSRKIMDFVATYTNSQVGAFYVSDHPDQLLLVNGFALSEGASRTTVRVGEGLVGQCAQTKKRLLLSGIREEDFNVSFASADLKPVNLIVFPLLYETAVKGVIELGAMHVYTQREQDFFKNVSDNIGVAVNTVQNRQRVQELLEETQSQSEELMAQQSELEQINSELEAQAQQLQTSEEELKVQSEELIQTNTLLEEKSAALEQRNQLIQQKNAEIEKRAEDLALSTKYKSEFLANMSHELRTPLNSILLLSRLLSENHYKNLNQDQVQSAEVIQQSGNGLLQLIDEILDLSKIESGKMTIESMPVRISDITGDINALFEPLAKDKRLQWKITIGAEVPKMIESDKMRIDQVLRNLLSNAFKFTSEGYIHLSVSCPVNRSGFVCFLVKDSGIGISADKQELIFEAFQQEDGSTRRKFGGTGLGLSISRELAKLLGGEITVTSIPGQGSEFECCIPISSNAAEQMQDSKQVLKATLPVPAPLVPDKYSTSIIPDEIEDDRNHILPGDKVILIVEDDTRFAATLLDYARLKGYKGVVAVRGDKAIEMAAGYLPDCILLDVQLPVKNGWEVIESIKNNARTRHIPVHMMSSFEVKKESLLKGAADFINKPVAFEQLDTVFEKLEYVLSERGKKVLIIEENIKHAKALAYYLGSYNVRTAICQSVDECISALYKEDIDSVILDTSSTGNSQDQLLEAIRGHDGFEDMPVILFTGKSLSQPEEFRIKKYADAIVLKTANSYRRVLDEVSLFLQLVQEQGSGKNPDFEKSVLQENVLKGKKVLLADDDVRNIFSMTRILEKYQMQVIPALDGREALQLMKTHSIDVVLMDMMMPELDGYESIRAIRGNQAFRYLPIIAVTAKAMSGDREKCIAAGASDYISKPVDMDQLVSLLRIWLYEKSY